jgi:hypothetical protein
VGNEVALGETGRLVVDALELQRAGARGLHKAVVQLYRGSSRPSLSELKRLRGYAPFDALIRPID